MNNPAATMSFWAAPAQARVTERFPCDHCGKQFDSARGRNAHLSKHKQHAPAIAGTRGRKPKDPYAQGFRDGAMLANKEHREARRLKAEIKALRAQVKSLRKVRKILDGVR